MKLTIKQLKRIIKEQVEESGRFAGTEPEKLVEMFEDALELYQRGLGEENDYEGLKQEILNRLNRLR
jgi:hypothetical protein